ncbi:M67 family metallopeptidase [Methylogaea oryzae]|uniref:M67 family metallopeptidase n=1 Tax=Methylogaea oryzae TaxID=1295382 RepID=UPI00278C436D|nr:M67 family metallopeptidase [Methylogaea oryzae]
MPASCYPVANAAGDPATRFQLDPQGQIAAMRAMREKGEALFAIFHSHPTAPALPSAEDAAQAAYPEALYLIISLNTKGVLELRGFRLQGQGFGEVELLLAEE